MQLFVAVLRKLSFLFVILFCSRSSLAQDLVLSGTVVTPDRVLAKGWVVIKDGRILSILEKAPDVAKGPRIESNGIIFPGFVDLHDHPMYNIFKRWSPKVKFRNRYEWRNLVDYYKLVGRPGGELQLKDDNDKNDQKFCDIDEYVEIKALMGGTTSITGISGRSQTPPVPSCVWGWHGISTGHRDSMVRVRATNGWKTPWVSHPETSTKKCSIESWVSSPTTRSICFWCMLPKALQRISNLVLNSAP